MLDSLECHAPAPDSVLLSRSSARPGDATKESKLAAVGAPAGAATACLAWERREPCPPDTGLDTAAAVRISSSVKSLSLHTRQWGTGLQRASRCADAAAAAAESDMQPPCAPLARMPRPEGSDLQATTPHAAWKRRPAAEQRAERCKRPLAQRADRLHRQGLLTAPAGAATPAQRAATGRTNFPGSLLGVERRFTDPNTTGAAILCAGSACSNRRAALSGHVGAATCRHHPSPRTHV